MPLFDLTPEAFQVRPLDPEEEKKKKNPLFNIPGELLGSAPGTPGVAGSELTQRVSGMSKTLLDSLLDTGRATREAALAASLSGQEPGSDQSAQPVPLLGSLPSAAVGMMGSGLQGVGRMAGALGMDGFAAFLRNGADALNAEADENRKARIANTAQEFGISEKWAGRVNTVSDMLASGVVTSSGILAAGPLATPAMFFMGLGEIDQMAREEGLSEEERNILLESSVAMLYAQIEKLGELGASPAFRNLTGKVGKALGEGLGEMAARGAQTSEIVTKFGLAESIEETLQDLATKGVVAGEGEGQQFTPGEILRSAGTAALGGVVGSLPFSALTSIVSAQTRRTIDSQEFTEDFLARTEPDVLAFEAAKKNSFDPTKLAPGTTIGNKTLSVSEDGTQRWRGPKGFAKAPTPAEVEAALAPASIATRLAKQVEKAVEPRVASETPVGAHAAFIASLEPGRDPTVVELSIKQQALHHMGSSAKIVRNNTRQEVDAILSDLEAIAIAPGDTDVETRISALAKKHAIEYRLRNPGVTSVENIDTSIGAAALAERDSVEFEQYAAVVEGSDNEMAKKMVREARAIRTLGTTESRSDQVRERLQKNAKGRSRGLGVGSQIIAPDGRVGTVVAVKPSGFVQALFTEPVQNDDGTKDNALLLLDPTTVSIVPKVGQSVELEGGQVGVVKQTTTKSVRVELPSGQSTTLPMESVKIQAATNTPAAKGRAATKKKEQEAATKVEPRTTLPQPIPAVDKRNGQVVPVAAIGAQTAQAADGSVVELANLDFGDGSTNTVPTFVAGLRPLKGSHINFLVLPQGPVSTNFEQAVAREDMDTVNEILDLQTNGGLYVLPQGTEPGTNLYAISIPDDARSLGSDAKALLGYMSGKKKGHGWAVPTGARVTMKRSVKSDEISVSRVPDGLRVMANDLNNSHVLQGLMEDRDRGNMLPSYLTRLTDLNFRIDPETGEALLAASEAAEAARDARIDGRVGEAEVAEINAAVARVEVAQVAIEKDIAERRAVWDVVKEKIRESMTPQQRTLIEVLNQSTRDGLMELPGIGKALADKIMKAREEQGGSFETIDDLLRLKGVDRKRLETIKDAIGSEKRLGGRHEEALKALLASMPGRMGPQDTGSWLPVFEHPDMPGMLLVIDKETIPTAENILGPLSTPQEIVDARTKKTRMETPGEARLRVRNATPGLIDTELGARDIYHIRYITPEMEEIRARTIGMGVNNDIKVPAHLMQGRNKMGTPPAIERINKARREGRSINSEVEAMRAERRKGQPRVTLKKSSSVEIPKGLALVAREEGLDQEEMKRAGLRIQEEGKTLRLISQEGNTAIVEDASGERFEIPVSEISDQIGEQDEPLVSVPMSIRLTPDEILSEVVREIRGFDRKTSFLTVGEWRSQVPGVYGEIREVKADSGPSLIKSIERRDEEGSKNGVWFRLTDGKTIVVTKYDEKKKHLDVNIVGPLENKIGIPTLRQVGPEILEETRKMGWDVKTIGGDRVTGSHYGKAGAPKGTGEWGDYVEFTATQVERGAKRVYQVALFERPMSRVHQRPHLYEMIALRTFNSQAEAENWLKERDFSKQSSRVDVRGQFAALPPVDSYKGNEAGLAAAHEVLSNVLEIYHKKGFIPQPVRDYAVAFAKVWTDIGISAGPRGIYGSRAIRRVLGIYTPADAQASAQYGVSHMRNPDSVALTSSPDVYLENGQLVVDRQTASENEDDIRVLDGILLSPAVEPTDPAAMEMAKALFHQDESRQRFLDIGPETKLENRLVEVGPQRKLGVVLDAMPSTNNLLVQVFHDGKPVVSTIEKREAMRIRSVDKANDYLRSAKDNLNELVSLPNTPGIGESPYDTRLGIGKVKSRTAYIGGLRNRVGMVFKTLKVAPDGNMTGDITKGIETLAYAYIRMQELGIPNQALVPEAASNEKSFLDRYGRVLAEAIGAGKLDKTSPLIPPVLMPTVRQAAYTELKNTYSGVSPFGDIIARAKLNMLTKRTIAQIDKQAKLHNIDTTMPTYRKVEELINNVYDPRTAHLMWSVRRELGALGAINATTAGKYGIDLRMPAMGSTIQTNAGLAAITFPREMANRSPTVRYFFHLTEMARTHMGNLIKNHAATIASLTRDHGMTLEREKEIWNLLQNEELGKAMENPSDILSRGKIIDTLGEANVPKGWDWYKHYKSMRELAVYARTRDIRNMLKRGFHFEEVKFDDNMTDVEKIATLELMKKDNTLSQLEVDQMKQRIAEGKKVFNLERRSNSQYARPDSEINAFLPILEQYDSLANVPQSIRRKMKPWMIDQFDFISSYGIKNYAPHILTGRHKIYMESTGAAGDELIAFAPDGQTFLEFAHRVANGEFASEGIPFNAKLYVEYGKAIADYDTDIKFLGAENYGRWYARGAHILGGKAGLMSELAKMTQQELRLGREPALPRNVHTEARIAELSELIESPYRRMLFYLGRVERNNFLLDIEAAYEGARAIDSGVSRAEGVDAVFPSSHGDSGTPVVRKYMEDLRDSYMGKPTQMEQTINRWVAIATSLELKPSLLAKLKKKAEDPHYSIMDDPEFVTALWSEDYASRKLAERLTMFQSIWRLGISPAAAGINALQHTIATASELVTRGFGVIDAERLTWAGTRDMLKFYAGHNEATKGGVRTPWGSKQRVTPADLAQFAEDVGVGVMPVGGMAGPGMGISEGKPILFRDDPLGVKARKQFNYYGMRMFSIAERQARLSTAFSARQAALEKGMTYDQAVTFARSIIDNTHFQYYDQALPPFMRGAPMRILFQFMQFPINMTKIQKDLLLGALPVGAPLGRTGMLRGQREVTGVDGKPLDASSQARKALGVSLAHGLAFGGAALLTHQLWSAPFNILLRILGYGMDGEELLANLFGGAEKAARESFGTNTADPELGAARNLALYGLPGLFGMQISARLGAGGMDLDPAKATSLLGPTVGMQLETYKMLGAYAKIRPTATYLGYSAGMLSQLMGARFPLGSIGAPLAAIELTSQVGDGELHDFLRYNPAGQSFVRAMNATIVRNIQSTQDIMSDDVVLDAFGNEHRFEPGLNSNFEAAYAALGVQTIRSAEERALVKYITHQQETRAARRTSWLAQAVNAARKGNGLSDPKVAEFIAQSRKPYGIFGIDAAITEDEVREALERSGVNPIQSTQERGPAIIRGGPSNPSGQP